MNDFAQAPGKVFGPLRGAFAAAAISMHYNTEQFAMVLKLCLLAVRGDFHGRVDEAVVVGGLKRRLGCGQRKAAINGRRAMLVRRKVYPERNWVAFVARNVHINAGTVDGSVRRVKLGEAAGKIIGKNAIPHSDQAAALLRVHPPRLLIRGFPGQRLAVCAARRELLDVFGKVVDGIAAGRPGRHYKIERRIAHSGYIDLDANQVRGGASELQTVLNPEWRTRRRARGKQRKSKKQQDAAQPAPGYK